MKTPEYTQQYNAIFDYLSAPTLPEQAESTVVFGRKDPLVAHRLGDLVIADKVDMAVITGGIGKDSGNIVELGFDSEAEYLRSELDVDAQARNYAATMPAILLEKEAHNGAENARNSLAIITEQGGRTDRLTAVAHATSALRLAESLAFEANQNSSVPVTIYRAPTSYAFNPKNPTDQNEAAAELLRLAEWPAKNWLGPVRSDLPLDLVDFAKDVHGKAPSQPPKIAFWVYDKLPAVVRKSVLDFMSKRKKSFTAVLFCYDDSNT